MLEGLKTLARKATPPGGGVRFAVVLSMVGWLVTACGGSPEVRAQASSAAPATTSPQIADFQKADGYEFVWEDAVHPGAEVFVSSQARAFLVMAGDLPAPILISPQAESVQTLQLLKVSRNDQGVVSILPDATLEDHGKLEIAPDGDGVMFSIGASSARLRNKPPLLGDHDAAGLAAHNADYGRAAEAYSVSEPLLRQLREVDEAVRVRVFFGSWCPYCQQVVPRAMRVAEELAGSNIAVEFHGLPRQISTDAEAKNLGIDSVPTGVVYRGGEEVGRIQGGSWKIPELAIKNTLDG